MKYHSEGRHGRAHLVQRFQLQVFTSQLENVYVGLRPSRVLGLAQKSYVQVKSIRSQNKRYASPTSHFWTCHEDWQFMTMTQCNFLIE